METNIHRIASVPSTQDVAREMLDQGDLVEGDVLLADQQSAGRGRFGRTWCSPRGGIYATLICPMTADLSLKAGLGIASSLREAGVDADLKWPNDVLVKGRKLGGVLVEQHANHALVGIGLNLQVAPLCDATCIAEHVEHPGDAKLWIRGIAHTLLSALGKPLDLDAYSQLCCTLGKSVTIERGAVTMTGRAEAIGPDGSLIVTVGRRRHIIRSGACRHLRTDNATDRRTNTEERR